MRQSCAIRPRGCAARKSKFKRDWRAKSQEVDGVVDEEVVAEVISKMTGVPVTRLEKAESERLLKLEDELHHTVVSQNDAIKAVAKAIRRARSGSERSQAADGIIYLCRTVRCGQNIALQVTG